MNKLISQNITKKLASGIISLLMYLSSAVFIALIALVAIDVIGRYLFNMPLFGSTELIEISMALLIFLSIPVATYKREHIRIALLEHILSQQTKRIIDNFITICFSGGLYLVSEKLWKLTSRFERRNSHTEFLEIPMQYISGIAILGCYLTIILLVLRVFHDNTTHNTK